MLNSLLDGIHEDLNRVTDKLFIEEPDLNGLTEGEIAELFWKNHLARNQSIIVDNMHGQYRSEVACPQCKSKSLAFDPFLMVTLQIPVTEKIIVEVYFVPLGREPTSVMRIQIEKNSKISRVKEEVSKLVQLGQNLLLVVGVVHSSYLDRIYKDSDTFDKHTVLVTYEKPDLDEDEMLLFIENFREPINRTGYTDKTPFAHPTLAVLKKTFVLTDLYFTVFKYFFESDSLDYFREKFPEFHDGIEPNILRIRFCNQNKRRSSYSKPIPCPYCKSPKCSNCDIPFNGTPLIDCISKAESEFKIEILWSKHIERSLAHKLTTFTRHSSSYSISSLSENSKRVSIYDCLEYSASPEELDENNTVYCKHCKDHVQGTKQLSLYKLPKYLIFHIKRFKQSGYFSSKNNKIIEFPIENLNMQAHSILPGEAYDLYAVCNHYGSMTFGHYTAYAKNFKENRWYCFDDSRVSPVRDEQSIIGEAAYVLFYKKQE